MKVETGKLFEEGIRSRGQTEVDVALRGTDPDQRIEKRVRPHDIPAGTVLLNQQCLSETGVEVRFHSTDFDACGFFDDSARPAILLTAKGVAILRQAAFEVLRFADIDELVRSVID